MISSESINTTAIIANIKFKAGTVPHSSLKQVLYHPVKR